jgi:hypothetical protein
MWYVLGYPMHKQSPVVQRLSCTLQYDPQVQIDPDMAPEDVQISVQEQMEFSVSHIKSWFILNTHDAFARTLTYVEIPTHYVWHSSGKWKRRVKRSPGSAALGRIFPVDPSSQETWALRLLLHKAKGCRSEIDLRTVGGVVNLSFVEAAMAAGIIRVRVLVCDCVIVWVVTCNVLLATFKWFWCCWCRLHGGGCGT